MKDSSHKLSLALFPNGIVLESQAGLCEEYEEYEEWKQTP